MCYTSTLIILLLQIPQYDLVHRAVIETRIFFGVYKYTTDRDTFQLTFSSYAQTGRLDSQVFRFSFPFLVSEQARIPGTLSEGVLTRNRLEQDFRNVLEIRRAGKFT